MKANGWKCGHANGASVTELCHAIHFGVTSHAKCHGVTQLSRVNYALDTPVWLVSHASVYGVTITTSHTMVMMKMTSS